MCVFGGLLTLLRGVRLTKDKKSEAEGSKLKEMMLQY